MAKKQQNMQLTNQSTIPYVQNMIEIEVNATTYVGQWKGPSVRPPSLFVTS